MNFLAICVDANRYSGMQGTITNPATETGYQRILCDFCSEAYIYLQNYRKDWPWMRSSTTFNTVAGTTEYSLQDIVNLGNTIDIARYRRGMIYYTDSSSENNVLRQWSYDRYTYESVDDDPQMYPWVYAEDPVDRHLYINPPDAVYTITCHYFTRPTDLSATADTPVLPAMYHSWIAYEGAARFAAFMGNQTIHSKNQEIADKILGNILRDTNPGKIVNMRGGAA